MTATCFVDSNVVIYAFDPREPHKQKIAALLLGNLWATNSAVISAQVINESLNKLLRLYRDLESPRATRERLRPYLAWIGPAIDEPLVRAAWALSDRHSVSHWDALIVAAAQRAGCGVLYSEDMHAGMLFDCGLRVVNPFVDAGNDLPAADRYTVQQTRATYNLDVKAPRGQRKRRG